MTTTERADTLYRAEHAIDRDRLDSFDAKLCTCGHIYGRHPWEGNPRRHGCCLDCPCRHRVDAAVQAEAAQRRALADDPSHVHGPIGEAIACGRGGYSITLLVCRECGAEVGRR